MSHSSTPPSPDEDRTHYDVLGVDPAAQASEIRRAFRQRSRENHPDVGGERRVYERITVAYTVLANAESRASYDLSLRRGPAAAAQATPASGGQRAGAAPAPSGTGRRAASRPAAEPKPVRVIPASGDQAPDPTVPVHGKVPKRGLIDRSRDVRTASVRELLRLIQREIPAARAVLGVDLPGAGRHDAVLVAGGRAVVVDVLPTPDTAHAWDGRTLRVNGKVVTLPNSAAAAAALERAAGGTRAEGLGVLVTTPPDVFRPVVDRVGPVHGPEGPANLIKASERICTFLAGGSAWDAVDLGILGRVISLATHR